MTYNLSLAIVCIMAVLPLIFIMFLDTAMLKDALAKLKEEAKQDYYDSKLKAKLSISQIRYNFKSRNL